MNKKAFIALLIAVAVAAVALFVVTRGEKDHESTTTSNVVVELNPEAKAHCAETGALLTEAWSRLFDIMINEEAGATTTARNGIVATEVWINDCESYAPEKAAEFKLMLRDVEPIINR